MNLPVEEAIRQLKAEIIAQDWRISPKRAEMIGNSISCLQQHFVDRKETRAMLAMAQSVLDYIRNNGAKPPETIDFLKEAMAHVVEQYESLQYDKKDEEKVFKALFHHFSHLKERIKEVGKPLPSPTPIKNITPKKNSETKELLNELVVSLKKAGDQGSTITDLLNKLIARKAFTELTAALSAANLQKFEKKQPLRQPDKKMAQTTLSLHNCPPTECRQIIIAQKKLALLTQSIAAHKYIKKSKLATYLKKAQVPLTFFSKTFFGLSDQFKGPLAQISSRKLKKISLPIIFPQWIDMPDLLESNVNQLLVVTNGNWHGIIACSLVDQPLGNMVKFIKEPNGDIIGTGLIEDNTKISLLDSSAIIQREGFLLMP